MKKMFIILALLFLTVGCGDKKEEVVEKKILSTGELVCVYKEKRTNINTLYTSTYHFNFNDNGILEDTTNIEEVEFDDATDETKDYYKKAMNEAEKNYEDIESITTKKELEDNKYSLEINIKVIGLSDEDKEHYLVNYDRINTYKIFEGMGYTCN